MLPLRVALTNFPLSCSMNLSKFVKAHCWPSMSKGSKFYWKCYNLLMLFNICHICLSNIKAFDVRKIKCSAIKGKRTSLRVTQNQKPRNATSLSKKRDPLPTCYYCLLPQKKTTTWKQKCTRFVDIKTLNLNYKHLKLWIKFNPKILANQNICCCDGLINQFHISVLSKTLAQDQAQKCWVWPKTS